MTTRVQSIYYELDIKVQVIIIILRRKTEGNVKRFITVPVMVVLRKSLGDPSHTMGVSVTPRGVTVLSLT